MRYPTVLTGTRWQGRRNANISLLKRNLLWGPFFFNRKSRQNKGFHQSFRNQKRHQSNSKYAFFVESQKIQKRTVLDPPFGQSSPSKRDHNFNTNPMALQQMERTSPIPVLAAVVAAGLLFILIYISSPSNSSTPATFACPGSLPSFAYYISGGAGDGHRILRLLLAVYHPRNRYLLHLSADAADSERSDLAESVMVIPAVGAFSNVDVIGKADVVSPMGASELAATLHGAAVLLKLDGGWDWFVTLSAADYPLVTQDDLIHAFSSAPRDLNFIDHTSNLGWKEIHRVQPIVVDPGLYLSRKSQIFEATERRETPNAFRFFTGSPWVVLSRAFIEFCVLGSDNLPRNLLLYFTNVILSREGYFHSVICNSPEFQNLTVNHDLRYMVWDRAPGMEPQFLNLSHYDKMVGESRTPFARKFLEDELVLDWIDAEMLGRERHRLVPGAWCSARRRLWTDPCSKWGDVEVVRPGPQAEKLRELIKVLIRDWKLQSRTCK